MPRIRTDRWTLWYESYAPQGEETQPYPVLLIAGFSMQATHWPESLIDALRGYGFRVLVFDNRDIGLSDRMKGVRAPDPFRMLAGRFTGRHHLAPYPLDAMADDAVSLLDALELEKAHVVGMSMGGMIAQLVALRHPDRVASLCSWSSMGGRVADLFIAPRMLPKMLLPPSKDPKKRLEEAVSMWVSIGTKTYPTDPKEAEEMAVTSLERAPDESGIPRQFAAILAAPSRISALRELDVPTLVVHGDMDPLVPFFAGKRVARAIPNVIFHVIKGYGHNLPEVLMPRIAHQIAANAARALT